VFSVLQAELKESLKQIEFQVRWSVS